MQTILYDFKIDFSKILSVSDPNIMTGRATRMRARSPRGKARSPDARRRFSFWEVCVPRAREAILASFQ